MFVFPFQGGGGAQDMSDAAVKARARGGSSAVQLDDIVSDIKSAKARLLQET